MSLNREVAIQFPRLKELVRGSDHGLQDCADAVRRMNRLVHGDDHWILTPAKRQHRATLRKLANMLEQLAMLDDLDLFHLSFACPEQLRRYDQSLRATVPDAYFGGIDPHTLRIVEEVHERTWQMMNEVTLLFDGLS